MATISRFEDLEIWKNARLQCKMYWQLRNASGLKNDFKTDNQMNRSCGSVMDNIAEGFGRENRKEFITFLAIAKASNAEFRSQLYRCIDRNYMDLNAFNQFSESNEKIGAAIRSMINYLKKSEIRGGRYKMEEESLFYGHGAENADKP